MPLRGLFASELETGSIGTVTEPDAAPNRTTVMPRDLEHLSDEAILALVARGEEHALAELYDRYGGPAFGLAHRILRDTTLAEDAVQDAFLAVWREAGAFAADRSRAATWVMMLVHRRAVDLVRHEQRRRTDQLPDDFSGAAGDRADDAVWLRFERQRVQDALKRLPDAQRETIELAYYHGFTQSELAERLGRPLGTVKSQMFSGLATLRQLLEAPLSGDEAWKTS
jgi:RNA polymerase sigma-70 factor (ECF subfamily)